MQFLSVLDKDSVLSAIGVLVLVGVGTDGAAVNIGEHRGLKAQMQEALPWLFWGAGVTHTV